MGFLLPFRRPHAQRRPHHLREFPAAAQYRRLQRLVGDVAVVLFPLLPFLVLAGSYTRFPFSRSDPAFFDRLLFRAPRALIRCIRH